MRLSDYKGEKNSTFRKAVTWLNKHQNKIRSLAGIGVFSKGFGESSWGMPNFSRLNPDQIQWIRSQTTDWLDEQCTALDDFDMTIPSDATVVV